MNYNDYWTDGQVMSWFHGKILRISHGIQNPTKRFITKENLIELCNEDFIIQEKVDGKLSCESWMYEHLKIFDIYEDMTHKNTCHNHVMEYNNLPVNKRIFLERIVQKPNEEPFIFQHNIDVSYAIINGKNKSIDEIYSMLENYSNLKSHYGSNDIEGLVLKTFLTHNYELKDIVNNDVKLPEVKFAKWINQKFEDKVHGVE